MMSEIGLNASAFGINVKNLSSSLPKRCRIIACAFFCVFAHTRIAFPFADRKEAMLRTCRPLKNIPSCSWLRSIRYQAMFGSLSSDAESITHPRINGIFFCSS